MAGLGMRFIPLISVAFLLLLLQLTVGLLLSEYKIFCFIHQFKRLLLSL